MSGSGRARRHASSPSRVRELRTCATSKERLVSGVICAVAMQQNDGIHFSVFFVQTQESLSNTVPSLSWEGRGY
jgi:hypothetical protein